MKSWSVVISFAKLGAIAVLAASLSACIVAPIGHHPRAVVVEAPVVVAPAPPVVVVRPAVRRGYYPYRHRY